MSNNLHDLQQITGCDLDTPRTSKRALDKLLQIDPEGAVFCAQAYADAVAYVIDHTVTGYLDVMGDDDTAHARRLHLVQLIIDARNPEEWGKETEDMGNLIRHYHRFLVKLAHHAGGRMLYDVVERHPQLVVPQSYPDFIKDYEKGLLLGALAGHEKRAGIPPTQRLTRAAGLQ